jgi:hypothetical protein
VFDRIVFFNCLPIYRFTQQFGALFIPSKAAARAVYPLILCANFGLGTNEEELSIFSVFFKAARLNWIDTFAICTTGLESVLLGHTVFFLPLPAIDKGTQVKLCKQTYSPTDGGIAFACIRVTVWRRYAYAAIQLPLLNRLWSSLQYVLVSPFLENGH